MPRRPTPKPSRTFFRPALEVLEDRILPSAAIPADPGTSGTSTAPYSTTDILVRFDTAAGGAPVSELDGTTVGAELDPSTGLYQVNLSPGVTVAQAIAAYLLDPYVVSAEPDYNVSPASESTSTDPLPATTAASTAPPASTIDLSGLSVNNSSYSTTDILVMFNTAGGANPAALAGTTLGTELDPGTYQVNLSPGVSVDQAVAAYQADPGVLAAEPDYFLADSSTGSTGVVPNNPDFSQQWDLQNTGQNGGTPGDDIGATQAWTVTTGSPNIVVGVLDTGVDYNASDLYQNIWINQAEIPASRMQNLVDVYHDGYISMRDLNNPINWGPYKIEPGPNGVVTAAQILAPMGMTNGKDNGTGGWAYPGNTQDGDTAHPNDFIGWNFVNNTNNPLDQNGHGTFVASEIAGMGSTGTTSAGTAGVDWNVQIMPVQFLSSGGNGSIGNFISALNYSVAHGAKITNNSWEGAPNDPFLQQAIANAQAKGQIFVAAAGNESSNNDTNPEYPSGFNLNNIVAVAASDDNDNLAGFSNYGATSVDLAAPGVNIEGALLNNSYGTLSGTSMSTPLVTGALALVWGEHPTWTYTQVINQVLSTVTKVPGLSGKVASGGVLNLAAAVGYKSGPAITPQVTSSSASGLSPNTDNDVRLTFNEAVNPTTFTSSSVVLTGPSGQVIPVSAVTPVAGSNNTQFDVQFATQTAGGTYTLKVGPNLQDMAGNAMTQAYTTTFTIIPTYTFSSSGPTALPAGSWLATSAINVNQALTIGQATVQLNLTFPRDGNLYVFLQAPDGTMIALSNRSGGTGANFQNTTFSDLASTPITSGQAPFAGSYQPVTALSNLIGKNSSGIWKLWVENLGGTGSGTLNGWSLTFTPRSSGTGQTASIASVDSAAVEPLTTASLPASPPGGPDDAGSNPGVPPGPGGLPAPDLGTGYVPPPGSGTPPPPPAGPPLGPSSRSAVFTPADGVFGSDETMSGLRLGSLFESDDSGDEDSEDTPD